ncbi:MAG: hypothetical protein VX614_10565 [Myxococcota bacterium]|nr:hypothetical protein [Myxococcota bacterium]
MKRFDYSFAMRKVDTARTYFGVRVDGRLSTPTPTRRALGSDPVQVGVLSRLR